MRLPLRLLLLAGSGSVLGLALNAASPKPAALARPVYAAAESGGGTCSAPHGEPGGRPSGYRPIRLADAVGLCQACSAGFVDARASSEYAEGHIPGAFHLAPHQHGDEAEVLAALKGYATVVVYDSGQACNLAEAVADHLREEGLADVRILEGAWPAWVQGQGPAESGACQRCLAEAHR